MSITVKSKDDGGILETSHVKKTCNNEMWASPDVPMHDGLKWLNNHLIVVEHLKVTRDQIGVGCH
ncbi:hypothetical protein QJS04_geneDACA006394 [Acorus gramineus]|uniref:Uncharacterized protein n=1 Tax=Acorus gramineus TaxID=55184 RepID=A0AAV9AUX3_ACOGR|nr:hypothetical protein QJS04_geneDACA006394 [Acorus gramineus]